MTGWWFIDNSNLEGQIKEAAIQAIFWCITLSVIRYYLRIYITNAPFFKHVSTQEGGINELLGFITCVPQHTTSVILLWVGMTFDRTDIFRSAVLAEFGYEIYDLTNVYIEYFFSNAPKTEKEKKNMMLALKVITFHHLPGITVIIPAVNAFGNDIYFQNVVWSLLSYTPIWVALIALYKCVDINDLNGRTQFTVYYFLSLIIIICGRFIWSPIEIYRFLTHTFTEQGFAMKCGLIFYAILIYAFNCLVTMVSVERLYKYMFVARKNEQEQVKAAQILRKTSSNDIFTDFVANGLDFEFFGDQKTVKKPKFKRHHTEPIHALK